MGIFPVSLLEVVMGRFLEFFMFCDGAILVGFSWDEWLRLEVKCAVLLIV